MTINIADLYASLEIMWKGMLGLFAICGFITLLVMFITRIFSVKNKNKADGA